jgi:thiol-disulfide isomerase/thioredoxin
VKNTLLSLVCFVGAGAACNQKSEPPVVSSRYEAVKAVAASTAHWCDTTFTTGGPRLTLPSLAPVGAGIARASLPKGKRVWLNLWATWCTPCLREIPLLLKWRDDLRKDGVDVEVLLLSLDEDAATLDTFLAQRKDVPAALVARAASQADYQQWAKSYLKDPTTPIPIHFLAAGDGGLRCIRSGSLREGDYPAAKAALR